MCYRNLVSIIKTATILMLPVRNSVGTCKLSCLFLCFVLFSCHMNHRCKTRWLEWELLSIISKLLAEKRLKRNQITMCHNWRVQILWICCYLMLFLLLHCYDRSNYWWRNTVRKSKSSDKLQLLQNHRIATQFCKRFTTCSKLYCKLIVVCVSVIKTKQKTLSCIFFPS